MPVQVVLAVFEKIYSSHETVVAGRLRVQRNKNVIRSNRNILLQNLLRHGADAAWAYDVAGNTCAPGDSQQRLVGDRVVRITDGGRAGKITGALGRRRNISLLRSGLRPILEPL